ncbi:DUF808 domain-containing protein [Corynebacterium ulceribovis]|uniref:DUF808 domain-containing protein n=1 Tax=Corynebacterium ulceribovis TaxID=487732 RepID=UPI0003677B6D|nr:DUF808 domain-containing protein [Corynebacterium ulceribovis]
MSGGLAALLDDVAVIAKAAAASVDDVGAAAGKAGAKAAGVVVDDTAVTPQYVSGATPARELPMIWRITKGSLVNKLIIILPIALLLSQFLPWALTPILMLGGTYLCFEGMEKVWEKVSGHGDDEPAQEKGEQSEDALVKSAIFTDLILSAEIMVIALNEVADETLLRRTIVLIVVAIAITFGVYGFVGLLVKMDDIGLALTHRKTSATQAFGRGLVKAMPIVLNIIGIVGTFAMLWVGGHILVVGFDELGWHLPYSLVHGMESAVPAGFLGWLANTIGSLIFGTIIGSIVVAVVEGIHALRGGTKERVDDTQEAEVPAPIRAGAGKLTPGGIVAKRKD